MNSKLTHLKDILGQMKSVAIAFSGGIDSTLLAKVAFDVLGNQAIAVTGDSDTYKNSERQAAKETAAHIGIAHAIITTGELDNPAFAANPKNRCFYCKDELFSKLLNFANEQDLTFVAEGSNWDDLSDFRPGMQAAKKLGVRQPLIEARLGKSEIRQLAKKLGLKNWNKPAAPCLSSRIPYGQRITKTTLEQIELGEEYLQSQGFKEFRLRHHDVIARIEVPPAQFPELLEHREDVIAKFNELGFKYITLDLKGFRSGSLNEAINQNNKKDQRII